MMVTRAMTPSTDPDSMTTPVRDEARELVVLLHGLGRTRRSMLPIARAVGAAGFSTLNYGYRSRHARAAEHGRALGRRLAAVGHDTSLSRIHVIGHSLGNILIRWVIAYERPSRIGHIVMLGPPNQGSRMADRFAPWLTWFSNPLPDLTTDEGGTSRSIPTPPGIPIGIIAGDRDGLVSVAETHLAGEREHRVVRSGHTFMMRRAEVHRLTIAFLRTGHF